MRLQPGLRGKLRTAPRQRYLKEKIASNAASIFGTGLDPPRLAGIFCPGSSNSLASMVRPRSTTFTTDQAGIAIENVRLFDEIQENSR